MTRGKGQSKGRRARFPWEDDGPVRLGVSSCLLGHRVRWDGSHKRDSILTGLFGPLVEWAPVCPEVEVGMEVPREPVRLVSSGRERRLVSERSGVDYTRAMRALARKRARELEKLDVCGYVFKRNSPSCGLDRVRVYSSRGAPSRVGRGLFAHGLTEHLGSLPAIEEGQLARPRLRENFVERVFAYRRLRSLISRRYRVEDLDAFHEAHRLQLLAHSPADSKALGRLVGRGARLDRRDLRSRYQAGFMRALSRLPTRRRHASVLHHVLGYLRDRLDSRDRLALLRAVEDFRSGHLSLMVLLPLLHHHVRRLGIEDLAGQVYLDPHPKEIVLRTQG